MKTNLEKWNYYLSIVTEKTNRFIDSQKEGVSIPEIYYIVYPAGKIAEREIIGITYSHCKHRGITYFNGKLPTKEDVAQLKTYSESDIPFIIDNIWFTYKEIWDKENGRTSTSSVRFSDIVNKKGLFLNIEEARECAESVIRKTKEDAEFDAKYAKDANYNYTANGYRFLGWQNGWKHEYYDEDGILCSISGKPQKSVGYSKEDFPEYGKCVESKHRKIEVHHNSRGSENTVSCPICMIYWKYDCSD